MGWSGAALLVLSGAGWGAQLSRRGLTLPMLLGSLALSALGLGLSIDAFLRGLDLPLILGAVGALGASVLLMFTRRE